MMGNFFGDFGLYHWSSRVSSLKGSIEFLVQKGASINRWRSLVVRAEIPQVLYKTLEYISPESAPSLRFLSFKWKPCGGPETIEREDQSLEDFTTLDQGFPSSSDQFPQLRTVQFTAVPADFLLRRPLPMFVGLVHLKLISASRWFPLPKLHALFSANLQLESLSLGASFAVGNLVEVADCQVTLPFLRSLALAWEAWDEMSLLWALGIIKMIDGPVVEHLELASVGSSNEELLRLTKQIAPSAPKNGKVGTPSRPPSDQTPCRSIYPTLRYLNITKLEPANGCDEAFQALLSALPTITSLAAPHSALDLLGRVPWLLPRLERIRFFGCPPEELGSILSRRMDDGSPLKTLEIPGIYLQSICGSWARSLNIVKLPATEAAEYYESDDDDDDEEEEGYDDDDEGTDLGDFSEGDSGEDFLEDHYDSFGVDSYEAAMESAWQRFQAEQDWEDGEVDGEEEHDDGESGEGEGEDGEGDEEGGTLNPGPTGFAHVAIAVSLELATPAFPSIMLLYNSHQIFAMKQAGANHFGCTLAETE
ncbi:hypothetical protein FRC10_004479 [Ceratobasidium sp. 414]|nr:hypothetical protein FRC10_004479 [Ceratobasidium sp. 414]